MQQRDQVHVTVQLLQHGHASMGLEPKPEPRLTHSEQLRELLRLGHGPQACQWQVGQGSEGLGQFVKEASQRQRRPSRLPDSPPEMARLALRPAIDHGRLLNDAYATKTVVCTRPELSDPDDHDVDAEHAHAAGISERTDGCRAEPRGPDLLPWEGLPSQEGRPR